MAVIKSFFLTFFLLDIKFIVLTIKVNISYIRATQKCKINQLPSQTHISIDEQKEFESNLKRQQFQSQIITK